MRSSTHARLIALRPFKNAALVCAAATLYALQAGAAAAQAPKQGTAVKTLVSRTVAKPAALYAYDIGNLGDTSGYCAVTDINDSGQLVGNSYATDERKRAFLTGPRGQGIRDLGSIDGAGVGESSAVAVNNDGVVVGYSTDPLTGRIRPMLTQADGQAPSQMALDPQAYYIYLRAINDAGDVVGDYMTEDFQKFTFISTQSGQAWRNLPEIQNSELNQLRSVNNSGQIVGVRNITGSSISKAYILKSPDDTQPIFIEPTNNQLYSVPVKISNAGRVVVGMGGGQLPNGKQMKTDFVLMDANGDNLQPVANRKPKLAEPRINDMTDDGLMVGSVYSKPLFPQARLHQRPWAVDESGVEWDIKSMIVNRPKGMYLYDVKAVNKHHQMAVAAWTETGMPHCFIVCPTENCVVPGQAERKRAAPADQPK